MIHSRRKKLYILFVFVFVSIFPLADLASQEKEREKELFHLLEQRRGWLAKNALLLSEVSAERNGSGHFDSFKIRPGSYLLFSRDTEYLGNIVVNKETCFSTLADSCSAMNLVDTDYIVPIFLFNGFYAVMDKPVSEKQSPAGVETEVIVVNPWPIIEHEQSYQMRFDPLSWFLLLGCSNSNEQINCETARRQGEQRIGHYFFIESDPIGRIIRTDEFSVEQLIQRQRFFYDDSVSLINEFASEYREARGHYSLLYVFDPLGNRGRHAIYGY